MTDLTLETQGAQTGHVAKVRRIVMIGFMGAGKSTVGRLLADALDWDFIDLDHEVERRAGMPVHEIIRDKGLDDFRRRESEVGRQILRRKQLVFSVGGGWPAQPDHMELLEGDTVSIWLKVGVVSALKRIAASTSVRPLLQVPDPVETATALLAERERHYRRGSIAIETEGKSPDQVLGMILGFFSISENGSVPGRMERRKEDIA